ncbi:HTH_48 domain-containing protein [Trichonephila clavipes]|nr:HTH_48 domain-containing protein [Trichonephila clavipes]
MRMRHNVHGLLIHCEQVDGIWSTAENDPNFLKSIVTGDETLCFQCDPETKRQSAEWKSENSPQSKKTRKIPYKIKTMRITFFDARGIIYEEFVPIGQTITGQYYLSFLMHLMARIRRIRPEYRTKSSWCLKHDNALSHTSIVFRLGKK